MDAVDIVTFPLASRNLIVPVDMIVIGPGPGPLVIVEFGGLPLVMVPPEPPPDADEPVPPKICAVADEKPVIKIIRKTMAVPAYILFI